MEKNTSPNGNGVLTKKALIQTVSARSGESQATVRKVLEEVLETIREELAERKEIVFKNFGKFYLSQRGPKVARNFKTGEKITVPSSWVVRFKPSKKFF